MRRSGLVWALSLLASGCALGPATRVVPSQTPVVGQVLAAGGAIALFDTTARITLGGALYVSIVCVLEPLNIRRLCV